MQKIIVGCLLLLLSSFAAAQNIVWQVHPKDYTKIERVTRDVYLASVGGKRCLMHGDGTKMTEPDDLVLGLLYDGMALLTKQMDGKTQILGALTEKGNYVSFSDVYYTVKDMEFYSDGLLPAADEKGRLGYVDKQGDPVIGFNGKFSKIKPFTEGYAAVFNKKNEFYLIDTDGKEVPMITGFEVGGGTNVFNGTAYIWNAYGDAFYTFNPQTGKARKVKKPASSKSDYLFCFSDITNRSKQPEWQKFSIGEIGLEPTKQGGLYGYVEGDKVLLPCQFDDAKAFEDGLAVAKLKGKVGILRWMEGGDFALSTTQEHHEYKAGTKVDCDFTLQIPPAYQNENVHVTLWDVPTGNEVVINGSSSGYSFAVTPSTDVRHFVVRAATDDLQLWEGDIAYTFKKKQAARLTLAVSDNGPRANENDVLQVTVRIGNPSEEVVNTSIALNCDCEFFVPLKQQISIAAGSFTTLTTVFRGINKRCGKQVVTVTTGHGESTKHTMEVWPYYD